MLSNPFLDNPQSHGGWRFNPIWTYLPQTTQLCGLCRFEETPAAVYFKGGSARTSVRAATLRQRL